MAAEADDGTAESGKLRGKNMLKLFNLCLILLLIGGCFEKSKDDLSIMTKSGEVKYSVETAVSAEELQTGLMNREHLDENSGMIFDLSFSGEKITSMWMKNTKIPLDMLFLDINGKVVWIYENAIPYSESLITPPIAAPYVVELNAGQVHKNNIQVGDIVKHRLIKPKAEHKDPEVHK